MVVIKICDCIATQPLRFPQSAVMPVPVKVAAKLNKRLRGKENLGGLAGSYRHLFGVYVTTERSLRHLDVAGEDLEEALEEADGEVEVGTAVVCAEAKALNDAAFSALVITSRVYPQKQSA